jgi:hypothetical protein
MNIYDSNAKGYKIYDPNSSDILNQNSIEYIKKIFDKIENPPKPVTYFDQFQIIKHGSKYSINTVSFVVKLFVFLIFIFVIWNFLNEK